MIPLSILLTHPLTTPSTISLKAPRDLDDVSPLSLILASLRLPCLVRTMLNLSLRPRPFQSAPPDPKYLGPHHGPSHTSSGVISILSILSILSTSCIMAIISPYRPTLHKAYGRRAQLPSISLSSAASWKPEARKMRGKDASYPDKQILPRY